MVLIENNVNLSDFNIDIIWSNINDRHRDNMGYI